MKSSIAEIWLVGLVITFLFIFSGYITVTMNYSKAFKLKNEVLTIIEKKKGITGDSGTKNKTSIKSGVGNVKIPKSALGTINVFLTGSGYSTKGHCPTENAYGIVSGGKEIWYGVSELTSGSTAYRVEQITDRNKDKKFYYCFSKKGRDGNRAGRSPLSRCDNKQEIPYYYDIVLFYKLDFPILGDLFTFRVDGTTADIYKVAKNKSASSVNYGCNFV